MPVDPNATTVPVDPGATPGDNCTAGRRNTDLDTMRLVRRVKAVVLVGGEGTRLRPLTLHDAEAAAADRESVPSSNVSSRGWPRTASTRSCCRWATSRTRSSEHFAGDGQATTCRAASTVRYVVEDEPLGTAGAIRFAAEGIDERFVVCNGDVLTDLDLGAMVRFHDERGAEATISLTQVEDPSAFGVVPDPRRR